jgi:hypothetical protein
VPVEVGGREIGEQTAVPVRGVGRIRKVEIDINWLVGMLTRGGRAGLRNFATTELRCGDGLVIETQDGLDRAHQLLGYGHGAHDRVKASAFLVFAAGMHRMYTRGGA